LLHVELDRIVDLLAGRGLPARHRQDQADLDGLIGSRRRQRNHACNGGYGRNRQQHFGANEHKRFLPSPASNRVPGPCLTIAQVFAPCSAGAWRPFRAVLSIRTIEAARASCWGQSEQKVSGILIPWTE